jgi:hypothetical protein
LEGSERNVLDKNGAVAFTTGSGVAMRASEDGVGRHAAGRLVYVQGAGDRLPAGRFAFPSGAVPMIPRDLRAFFNGRYGVSVDGSVVAMQGASVRRLDR